MSGLLERYAPFRFDVDRLDRGMGRTFVVAVNNQTMAANANEVASHLWNPDSLRSLWVIEVFLQLGGLPAADCGIKLVRTNTAGTTPGITRTPDLDNDDDHEVTPDTGAVAYGGQWGTQPVLDAPPMAQTTFWSSGSRHATHWRFPAGIRVPPGRGLGVAQVTASALSAANTTYRFRE